MYLSQHIIVYLIHIQRLWKKESHTHTREGFLSRSDADWKKETTLRGETGRDGENKHGERNNTGAKWTLSGQMREWINEQLTCSIPRCWKCRRIAAFSRGGPSLIANNNKWSGASRGMVMMLRIDAAIHHNRIYVRSHPLYRSSSCRGRSKGTHVFFLVFVSIWRWAQSAQAWAF